MLTSGAIGQASSLGEALDVRHLARSLKGAWLFWLYLGGGLLWGVLQGPPALARVLLNYLVLGGYFALIWIWTRKSPPEPPSSQERLHPVRDLLLVAVLFGLNFAYNVWFWNSPWFITVLWNIQAGLADWGLNYRLAELAANALLNSAGILLPALVVIFLVFRLRPRQVALRPRWLGLGVVLVLLSVPLTRLGGLLHHPASPDLADLALPVAAGSLVLQVFINALPEELIYRGVVVSRLLPWFANPLNALVPASILFVAMHVPSYLALDPRAGRAVIAITVLTSPLAQPTGLAWSFLRYRTGSIWPGVIWHASFGNVGSIFF